MILNDAGIEKLELRVKVQLKKWAGLSGFYGYKEMDFDQIYKLVNSGGWKTEIDASDPAKRVLRMTKEGVVRKAKFTLDEKGRVVRDY
ncbi:MAG: hypothetical protein K0R57_5082 [Paenibacillaceae bacterium]|jgi:hypothetical protein|nr:hypothetical protein [Paenibacillaceae bacterium]